MKLIPKKDAEPFLIKNWRPLTLLNCDYKIAAKSISNRLKPLLSILVHYDQTDFMKGRFIGENTCLIDSVICYAEKKKRKKNHAPYLKSACSTDQYFEIFIQLEMLRP